MCFCVDASASCRSRADCNNVSYRHATQIPRNGAAYVGLPVLHEERAPCMTRTRSVYYREGTAVNLTSPPVRRPTPADNVTLAVYAAARLLLTAGRAAIDRYLLLAAGPAAANLQQRPDGTDRLTPGRCIDPPPHTMALTYEPNLVRVTTNHRAKTYTTSNSFSRSTQLPGLFRSVIVRIIMIITTTTFTVLSS